MFDQLKEAAVLVELLNSIFDEKSIPHPIVSVEYTGYYLSIRYGEHLLWDSEGYHQGEDERYWGLTLETCLHGIREAAKECVHNSQILDDALVHLRRDT